MTIGGGGGGGGVLLNGSALLDEPGVDSFIDVFSVNSYFGREGRGG